MNFFKKVIGMINSKEDLEIEKEELEILKETLKTDEPEKSEKEPQNKVLDEDQETGLESLDTLKEAVETSKDYKIEIEKEEFDNSIYIPNSSEYFELEEKLEEIKARKEKEAGTEVDTTETKPEPRQKTTIVEIPQEKKKEPTPQIERESFEDDFSFGFFNEDEVEEESTKVTEKKVEEVQKVEKPKVESKPVEAKVEEAQIKKSTEVPVDSSFIKQKVREEFREELMKRVSGGSSISIPTTIETSPKKSLVNKELEERLIKERLYGEKVITQQKEKKEVNSDLFSDMDKKIIRVDMDKVNIYLEDQRKKIYSFMEQKINNCYKNIMIAVKDIQNQIKKINEKEVDGSGMTAIRDKMKLITELTLITNKYITPKTRGLKRVRQFYDTIQIALKEYDALLLRRNLRDFNDEIEVLSKKTTEIKKNADGLHEVFSLKSIEEIDNLQDKLQELFTKSKLKQKIIREIERRNNYMGKLQGYVKKIEGKKRQMEDSDTFQKFREKKALKENLQEEMKKLSKKIEQGFNDNKDILFADVDTYIISPIMKLYLRNVGETLKNDLNKELVDFLKRQLEINSKLDEVKIKSLMQLTHDFYSKNQEFKDLMNEINNNTVMQDELDMEYKQSHIDTNNKKVVEELEKLQVAYKKLDIAREKAELSKRISNQFNVNFLIS